MNFWKRLRLIGSLIVLGIAVLAVIVAVLRGPLGDDEAPSHRLRPDLNQLSGTKGL